jgi:hypothetical protein
MTEEEVLEIDNQLNSLLSSVSKSNKEKVRNILSLLSETVSNAEKKLIKKKYENMKFSHLEYNPLTQVSRAVASLSVLTSIYLEAQNNVSLCDKETQDILHALEFSELSDEAQLTLSMELQGIRRLRRSLKNFIELTEPLKDLVSKNQSFVTNLCKVQGTVQMIKKEIEKRSYHPRVRQDLLPLFTQSPVLEDNLG